MRLNVNRLLHTPDASQEVRFEMDLSQLDFGGAAPIIRPVTVEGRIRNQAGVLLCQLEMHTTLHCVCDRCMEEFDAPKSVSYSCVLAEEKQEEDSDEIILLEHDEVDLAELARDAFILDMDTECARSAVPTMAVRSSRSSPWPLANNDRVSLTGGKRGFPPAFLFAGKVCMSSAGYHGRCRSMGDAMPRQKIAAGWWEDTVAKSLPPCAKRKAQAS